MSDTEGGVAWRGLRGGAAACIQYCGVASEATHGGASNERSGRVAGVSPSRAEGAALAPEGFAGARLRDGHHITPGGSGSPALCLNGRGCEEAQPLHLRQDVGGDTRLTQNVAKFNS